MADGLLKTISKFLDETATTTTANVASYTQPLGVRVDRFIKRHTDDDEEEEETPSGGHLLTRKF